MKKLFLIPLFLVATNLMAADAKVMPTIYGKLNKEVQYVSQKKDYNYDNFHNVSDVFNSESRIGAKNTYEYDTMKAGYVLELGVRTPFDDSATDKISIRHSKVTMSDFWGTITLGKTDVASSTLLTEIDPLNHTSVAMTGADQAFLVKGALTGTETTKPIGYNYRGRKNLIGYTTPDFMGAQLNVTIDRSDKSKLDDQRPGEYVDAVLSYKMDMNDTKLALFGGIVNKMGRVSANVKKDMSYLAAVKFTMNPVTVAVIYQDKKQEVGATEAATTKPAKNWMSASVKYNITEKLMAALTYSSHTYDSKETGALKEKYSQIAAGLQHQCNDNVSVRLTAAQYSIKDSEADGLIDKKNSATMVALGAQLTF